MVRVCLYLALALGLAGSASGDCTVDFSGAEYAIGTTGNVNLHNGDCTKTASATLTDTNTCGIKCAGGYHMASTFRVASDEAMAYCKGTDLIKDVTCTLCTDQDNCGTSSTTACVTDAGSETLMQCTTVEKGYYKSSQVVKACTADTNCATSDATKDCVSTSTQYCTTPKAGYYVAAGVVSACFTDPRGTFNYADWDDTSYGASCAKAADGTKTTVKITACPPGTYLAKGATATADDVCTACHEATFSRCHCDAKGGASSCKATGECKNGYFKYEGEAGKTGKCTIHTACKAYELDSSDGDGTTDNSCKACKSIENVDAKKLSCSDLTNSQILAGNRGSYDGKTADAKCGKGSEAKWTATEASDAKTCTSDSCACTGANFDKAGVCTACSAVTGGTVKACTATGVAAITEYTCDSGKYKSAAGVCTACSGTVTCTGTQWKDASQCSSTAEGTCVTKKTCAGTGEFIYTAATGTSDAVCASFTAATASMGTFTIGERIDLEFDGTGLETTSNWGFSTAACTGTSLTNFVTNVQTAFSAIGNTVATGVTAGTKGQISAAGGVVGTCDNNIDTSDTVCTTDNSGAGGQAAGTWTAFAPGDLFVCFFPEQSDGTGLVAKQLGKITIAAAKNCQIQEWAESYPSCGITTTGSVGGGMTTTGAMIVTKKSGFQDKCTITCDANLGKFTVTEATAWKSQVGCKTDDTNNALADKVTAKCTALTAGYINRGDGTVLSCMTAGQEAKNAKGETLSCSNFCWYKGACKTGYTKTVGDGKSDTCVSDSAASLSLTAVLLSVVAKVFLF